LVCYWYDAEKGKEKAHSMNYSLVKDSSGNTIGVTIFNYNKSKICPPNPMSRLANPIGSDPDILQCLSQSGNCGPVGSTVTATFNPIGQISSNWSAASSCAATTLQQVNRAGGECLH
jgi:hypothetical protein